MTVKLVAGLAAVLVGLLVQASGATAQTGPCTNASKTAFPTGAGHDHKDITQHRFACRISQSAFLPLKEQLDDPTPGEDDNEVLGEMDVEADIAAVGVAYPEAGILFFDVSNPAHPRFLSRYSGPECEGLLIDVDCGAFVDLSSDGKLAFLSTQQISVVPGGSPPTPPDPSPARPGVQVINISDPRSPTLTWEQPVVSVGGVHTSRSHIIPAGQPDAVPGEYLFSVANGVGIDIYRVERGPAGAAILIKQKTIEIDEVHDMFLQNDPITGRTYMYVAPGFASGLYVYDVTNPAGATPLLAEWDLTPECGEDWYAHTVDVTTRHGRRYVTVDAEIFDFGEQTAEDQAQGCGRVVGNGDRPGPLWIIDASDFSRLGPANDQDGEEEGPPADALKAASQATLVTTWTNAANRPGGNLLFSPHNQQIVGNRIYLSQYHAGIVVLDASAAFRGRKVRPGELAFVVPSGTPTRPIFDGPVDPLLIPFFSTFIQARPDIWDQFFYKGYILAADMTGGFYSFR
jgi:hypothetical protein